MLFCESCCPEAPRLVQFALMRGTKALKENENRVLVATMWLVAPPHCILC